MMLPSTAAEVRTFLELHGFGLDDDCELLEYGTDPEQTETETVFVDHLTSEQLDGLDWAVRELTNGWPADPFVPTLQPVLF